MANLPTPKSYEQILGEMLATYQAKTNISDTNIGSVNLSFFEAVAQAIYRASGDSFSILRDFDVDRATGEKLKRIAAEERVTLESSKVATGKVTITDSSFEKISTKVYAGSTAPNAGSTVIKVSDASLFPGTGQIYVGRGTPNIEGPISYSSITPVGGYYEINLSSPTTKFHNLSESVVLAQGGTRTITSGQLVRVPGAGASPNIDFTVTQATILLDGENEITNVPVAAVVSGSEGNVTRGSIRQFDTAPFSGALVTNADPFTTGKDSESDDEIRTKIKRARISKGLGTAIAIKNATINAQSESENAQIISNEIFSSDNFATLFIDDGQGYEEKTNGIGLEFIVDSALGGENSFELSRDGNQTSVAKAFVQSVNSAPFIINSGDRLAVLVGGILSEHVFASTDFRSEGFATAFEVVSSINANPNLDFVARTVNSGTQFVITSKEESNETIQVTDPTAGIDASLNFGLPKTEIQTLRLYKNRVPLLRNGKNAIIESANQADWSSSIATNDTLILSVDSTSNITYTFTNADFIAEGTYTSVSKNNSLESWVNVINSKITGLTATINGSRLVLTSNLGASSRAALEIDDTSTLVTKGMFTVDSGLSSSGKESDFSLSRNTGQFKLKESLQPGDSLTAGTEFSKATIGSSAIPGGIVTLANDAYLWFSVDDKDAEFITIGAVTDTFITVSKPSSNVIRFTCSDTTAFLNTQIGDYLVVWSEELNVNNRLEGRIFFKSASYVDLKVTPSEYASAVSEVLVQISGGFAVLRSEFTPQKIKVSSGSYDINTLASDLQDKIVGVTTSTLDDEIINITTKTEDTYGRILVVTLTEDAKPIGFTENQDASSIQTHYAFYESQGYDGFFPYFIHSSATDNTIADPPNSLIADFDSTLDLTTLDVEPNNLVCFLHPYLNSGSYIEDMQADNECSQIKSFSTNTISITDSQFIRRIRQSDRYYVANPFDFAYNDSLVVILDNDVSNKTFPIPLYRKALVNSTASVSSTNFRAYDSDSGPTSQFSTYFGNDFDFKNYKVLMQARNAIDPVSLVDEDAILFRSAQWGKAGERIKVGYNYPTSANQGVSHTILVEDIITISINLKSGNAVANAIDGTTEFDVLVTPNTPVAGVDEVTYSWNSTGTNPGLGSLLPGHYVTINSNGEFHANNTGTFKVILATATSFTVYRPNGIAVGELNKACLTINTILTYENDDTTAQEIVTYVNASVSDWLQAEIIDDNGLTGAGIIDSSTYESNDYATDSDYVFLLDGENWLLSSNISASAPTAQFIFKIPLNLPEFDTNTNNAYTFNNGEEIRFIPTTAQQIVDFVSVLAVSGFTTLGNISTSDRARRIQISSQTLGSGGSVQIAGGSANEAAANILGQATSITEGDYTKFNISRSGSAGFHAGQWIKFEASEVSKRSVGISSGTSVTLHSNNIETNKTVIELENREVQDLYFGQPRPAFKDLDRAFLVERHGDLACISWDNTTGSNPNFTKSVEINADSGNIQVDFDGTLNLTKYIVTSGTRNFSEVSVGDSVVIQNLASAVNNGTFTIVGISSDKKTVLTNNTNGVDAAAASVAALDFVISTEIKEGDTLDIADPFNPLNQGTFRVIRRFSDSIYLDNSNAVEERVVVVDNLRNLGFDSSTEFDVTFPGNMRLTWNGTGTEPDLSVAKVGDYLEIGTAFNVNNRGVFMVTKSTKGLKEKFIITCPAASSFIGGERIHFDMPNSGTARYAWFDKDNLSVDPAPGGRTGTEVNIVTGDDSSDVANALKIELDLIAGITATVDGNIVTVEFDNYGPAIDAVNIDVDDLTILTLTQGSLITIECANSLAVAETGVNVTGVGGNILQNHISSMIFSAYENTRPGDIFVIANDVLDSSNIGEYQIAEVLDENRILVNNIMTIENSVSLVNDFESIYVNNGTVYTGYKRIYNIATDPANSNRTSLIVENSNQYLQINELTGVAIAAVSKLDFPTTIVKGLDSYRYHTGLIAKANQIVYGDPRDSVTYPGVAAAGAEIYIEPPLFKRIQVSISVRIRTGVPFSKVVEQVRNNVYSLINSSPIGQSIAISDIISTVNLIPGVFAVSISSPAYSPSSDVIRVSPNEKPLIIDIVNDITVSKIDG